MRSLPYPLLPLGFWLVPYPSSQSRIFCLHITLPFQFVCSHAQTFSTLSRCLRDPSLLSHFSLSFPSHEGVLVPWPTPPGSLLCSPLCDRGPSLSHVWCNGTQMWPLQSQMWPFLPLTSLPFVLLGWDTHVCVCSRPQFFLIKLCREFLNSTLSTLSASTCPFLFPDCISMFS